MQQKIAEQTKTIQYIKKLYKQKTGEQIVMPLSWQESLGIEEDQIPSRPFPNLNQETVTIIDFRTAIDQLNLPTRINATKLPLTSFSGNNKFHMVQHIELCGFEQLGFGKAVFREFLSRIVDMRALHSIALRNNGINDVCAEEIQALFTMKRISRIDLRANKMQKSCLQIITKNFQHIQWIDLSRNYFLFQIFSLQQLMNSIRTNGKIWHLCIDIQDAKMVNQICTYLKIKPHIHSFGLVDTKIDLESMGLICKVLEDNSANKKEKETRINYLDFSFCYLDRPVFVQLQKAISLNTTLVCLNLSNNNLGEPNCSSLCKTFESSISLIRVNLAGNLLQDSFAEALSECLNKNEIIQHFDISMNNIGQIGAKFIFESLSNKNDTLQSLGHYQTNERMGQQMIQKIRKALKINKVSKQIRSKIMAQQSQLSVAEISNRQTQAFLEAEYQDFDLLVPIAVSNPLRDDINQLHIWKFQ